MSTNADAGYEGQDTEDEGPVTWELLLHETIFTTSGLTCRLLRNGHPIGMVRVNSMEEFKWLAQRVNGTYDAESQT